jgi:hypothetical protein
MTQEELLTWYEKMSEAHDSMYEEDKQALAEWERENLDGSTVGTSDWPGWEKYIGKRPV